METLVAGDGSTPGDPQATFLWVTDAPELNEQTKKKIFASSEVFSSDRLTTVDASFDQPEFDPGTIYFLNTQKLGSHTTYSSHRDKRTNTLWETIANTARNRPDSFILILDEAQKGLGGGARAEREKTTIAHRLIAGGSTFLAPKLLMGISATPQRFNDLLERATDRVRYPTNVDPDDARASGLLKDEIVLWHTKKNCQTQWALLEKAAEKLADYERAWAKLAEASSGDKVRPILLVQVADGTKTKISRTELSLVIRHLESALGPLAAGELVHCFQDVASIDREDGPVIKRVAPSEIQEDQTVRVVLFKMALNTGWDCPRAEVMMSFRRAVDATLIAQLVGRMVRTPEGRRVAGNRFLNSVTLYLPNWNEEALDQVVKHLTEGEEAVPVAIERGENLISYSRRARSKPLFEALSALPTYPSRRQNKDSNVKRSMQLSRYLSADDLEPDALQTTRDLLLETLEHSRRRLTRTMYRMVAAVKSADLVESRVVIGLDPPTDAAEQSRSKGPLGLQRVDQDILDFFSECGRRLGSGLHVEYVKRRLEAVRAPTPTIARAEICVLINDEDTIDALERVAGDRVRDLWNATHEKRKGLPGERRADYARVNRMAMAPDAEDLIPPSSFEATKGPRAYSKHLYVAADGEYHPSPPLNKWERTTLAEEIKRRGFRGWLRNPVRKEWSLGIPYEDTGVPAIMYPDFLIFRLVEAGIVVDILEPHASNQADLAPKLSGLCRFANNHGDRFGRIEMILLRESKGGQGKDILRLDVNDADIREEAKLLTDNKQILALAERLARSR